MLGFLGFLQSKFKVSQLLVETILKIVAKVGRDINNIVFRCVPFYL